MDQIKTTTVTTRVTYFDGAIDPKYLPDGAPVNLCVRVYPVDFMTCRKGTNKLPDALIRGIIFLAAAGPLNCGGGKNESDINYVMGVYYGRNIKTDIDRSFDIKLAAEYRELPGYGRKYHYAFRTREDVHAALAGVPNEYMTKAQKKACEKLYPTSKDLGIEPDKQMTIFDVKGVNQYRCGIRITAGVLRRRNHYQNPRLQRFKI
ncbi:hypothetical protein ACI5EL_001061 [Escherichia coli]